MMRTFLVILLTTISLSGLATEPERKREKEIDPALADLIEKVDAKSATIETIKARFIQRKEVSLLKEPVEMGGDFYFKRKSGFKFDFDPEDDLLIIITNDETIALQNKAKKAGRFKMKKRHGRIVEKLLSEKIKSLTKNFVINQLPREEPGYHLSLKPTKRRLKKRFSEVQIVVNKDYLIQGLKVTLKDGDIYELHLDKIRLNEEIDTSFFDVTIPKDYKMDDRMDYLMGAGITF